MDNLYSYEVKMKRYPGTFRMGGVLEIFKNSDIIDIVSNSSEPVVFNDMVNSILDESSIRQLRNIESISLLK